MTFLFFRWFFILDQCVGDDSTIYAASKHAEALGGSMASNCKDFVKQLGEDNCDKTLKNSAKIVTGLKGTKFKYVRGANFTVGLICPEYCGECGIFPIHTLLNVFSNNTL